MKQGNIVLMAVAAALIPLTGWSATDANTGAPPPTLTIPADVKLSQPARDVVKMANSGVSDDVIKAYIDNSPAPFSLSADNIIHMQGVGVSGSVTSAMLTHDRKLSDQTAAAPPAFANQPPTAPYPYPGPPAEAPQATEPVNPVSTYTIPADTSYYSDLAPYGNWSYLPDYGWCWAPAFGLSYAYYPWGTLRYGRWCNFPGRGWCWLPGGGYRGSAGYYGGRGFVGGSFGRSAFYGGRSVSVTHIGGSSHFSGGFHSFGGGFRSAGGGFHSSGGFSHGGGGGHSSGGGHR